MINLDLNSYVSKDNRAIVVPKHPALENFFPDAKVLPHPKGDLLVIPHGLAEYSILKRLGVKRLEHPMLAYYNWAGLKPFDVQRSTCAMLTANPAGYVLNEMGTGKTKSALWAWDYLYGSGLCKKLLVLAKLSTLERVWQKECFDTIPHRKVAVLKGSKAKRLAALASDADIYVINHEGTKVIHKELMARTDIDVLCIDELGEFRNPNDMSKVVAKLARGMKWVWGLTGSPMPHEPVDVWMQCKIVTPHTVPDYRSHAKSMLMYKVAQHIWEPKENATEMAFAMMQPAVRYSLDDVVELPEIVLRDLNVKLGPKQDLAYKTIAKHFQLQIGTHEITALNAAGAMNKLLQIAGGFVYTREGETLTFDATERLDQVADIIATDPFKVLVFAPFRHMVEGVATHLRGLGVDLAVVHGGINDRATIFGDFQDTNRYKAIVAHPKCMAHGLTLTSASSIIWYVPLPNYDIYEQANARIRRVGQRNKQQIFHLQGTPVERRIYRLLKNKELAQDKLLSLFADATEDVTN